MKNINIKRLFKSEIIGNTIILITSMVLIYLLISLYFINHFLFNTVINGVDVSLKTYDAADSIIRNYTKDYKLQLIERNEKMEEITGWDIEMRYNQKSSISKIHQMQNKVGWITSLCKEQKYCSEDLFGYNKEKLDNKINKLECLNKNIIEPQNVSFKYSSGSYEWIKEIDGNKVYKDKLYKAIQMSILNGKTKLDLNKNLCYQNPKYILSSDKTLETKNLLNKYVTAEITYVFGSENEKLEKNVIYQWLSVDEQLEVVINKKAVKQYVNWLSKKYDTVGVARKIKTSTNKIIEVKGGFYGWKINNVAETAALLENIRQGEVIQKEPIYTQRALYRDEDDIGNTYIEINITRQHLWFYKEGKLVTQGAIVTGNPNKGNSTEVGVYMLNYKQKGSTLIGPNYEAEVTYWMPFNGNIGIHDASWRYSFGSNIYTRNGSHGCINAPLYLAKTIFENIDEGTPVICYEE